MTTDERFSLMEKNIEKLFNERFIQFLARMEAEYQDIKKLKFKNIFRRNKK